MNRKIQEPYLVTTEERHQFLEDGVVCLRQVIDAKWIDLTRKGIARNLREPGRFFRDQTPTHSPARYVFDYWSWRQIPEFAELIYDSPFAAIVVDLLEAKKLNLLMDNWFMREAGATSGAPWHHDEPYFDFFGGKKCVFWFPLEPVKAEEGLTFLAGSHRWNKLFMPSNFREKKPFGGDMSGYYSLDGVDFNASEHDFLTWDVELGDCLIFDFRTLHVATTEESALPSTIHRMSLRYGDQDVKFAPRGEWTLETSEYLQNLGCQSGGKVDCDLLPRVF
jgi:ectoine hydroxylase-related dioxygenase (phytanoyl-CoA dioxygenase family)